MVNSTLLYDGQENDYLYSGLQIKLEDNILITLSDILSQNQVDLLKKVEQKTIEELKTKCNEEFVSLYLYERNSSIFYFGFGEFQPARYKLFRFVVY